MRVLVTEDPDERVQGRRISANTGGETGRQFKQTRRPFCYRQAILAVVGRAV